jgi:hypothetical protein
LDFGFWIAVSEKPETIERQKFLAAGERGFRELNQTIKIREIRVYPRLKLF